MVPAYVKGYHIMPSNRNIIRIGRTDLCVHLVYTARVADIVTGSLKIIFNNGTKCT